MKNKYFINTTEEQRLLDDLIVESIQIHGTEVIYIPRIINNFDKINGTDDSSSYESTYPIEVYLDSFDGFAGDKELMSKLANYEIRDQLKLSVAKTAFYNQIGLPASLTRPREGDVIFFPEANKLFQIQFVDKYEMFYQLGKMYTWKMTLELFEYSNEVFATGITEIDRIYTESSTNIYDYALKDENGEMMVAEDGSIITNEKYDLEQIDKNVDSDTVTQQAETVVDWSEEDPYSEWGKL